MRLPGYMAGILMAVGCQAAIHAASRPVAVNVSALDASGRPVTDLTAGELSLFDNGSPRLIGSLRPPDREGPKALVILLDLLNSRSSLRGAVVSDVKGTSSQLPSRYALSLYLLVTNGSLYPVLPLAGSEVAQEGDAPSWAGEIGRRLDDAMRKNNGLSPLEMNAPVEDRFRGTLHALEDMSSRMALVPEPKELLWVTYGIPSSVDFGRGPVDVTPGLQQLGALIAKRGVALYTIDPSQDLERNRLNRQALQTLTATSGGRMFGLIDLKMAVAQMATDARAAYRLQFDTPAKNWDGKYHKLRLTSTRKGTRLLLPTGYCATDSGYSCR